MGSTIRSRGATSALIFGGVALVAQPAKTAPPIEITPTVLNEIPHATHVFTQGLLWHQGALFESGGLYGSSLLREVDPTNGQEVRAVPVDNSYFAEGLALVPDIYGGAGHHLILLTWKKEIALVYELEPFNQIDDFTYSGDGWGLCFDGIQLVMSNGSSTLFFRDPTTFAELSQVTVTIDGVERDRLNELECVGDAVYANVWQTDWIIRIDKQSGVVTTKIDCAGLLTPAEQAAADVLNGIAFVPDSATFYITGKWWPKMFEVDLGESPAPTDGGPGADGVGFDGGPAGDPMAPGDSVANGDAPQPGDPIAVADEPMVRGADSAGVGDPRGLIGVPAGGCQATSFGGPWLASGGGWLVMLVWLAWRQRLSRPRGRRRPTAHRYRAAGREPHRRSG